MVGPLRHVTKNNPVKKEEKPIFPFFMKDNTKNNKDEIFTFGKSSQERNKASRSVVTMMITPFKAFNRKKSLHIMKKIGYGCKKHLTKGRERTELKSQIINIP